MASATPCTGCYPGWPHSYPETQRDWILRFWTRGHRPDSQLLYENFEQVTHAEALKRKRSSRRSGARCERTPDACSSR